MHAHHKIIITGTGRAGTTFLVRLLTALGLPTGYDDENWRKEYFAHCAAGLERKLTDPAAPYIVKDPDLCLTLAGILAEGEIAIDHALVPIRELEAAALSRVRIGGANGEIPGGLIGTAAPEEQRAVLAERFHRLVYTLAAHDIPHTFLLFPRFVQDADYAFAKLRPAFPNLERESFDAAFKRIADPQLVHTFEKTSIRPSTEAASFRLVQERRRQWRHLRQRAAWTTVAASAMIGVGLAWRKPDTSLTEKPKPTNFRTLPNDRTDARWPYYFVSGAAQLSSFPVRQAIAASESSTELNFLPTE